GFDSNDGLDEFAGPDTAGARPDSARDAADHGPDFLQVQMPLPVRHVVGVADPVTGHRDLPAELTVLSHGFPSVATRGPKKRCILPSARPERNPPKARSRGPGGRSQSPELSTVDCRVSTASAS